ncbi:hypothetical protein [Mucilaginibacter sp.]|uniref:hypothetical protein n=1 Tax=Mucilaginibacter sp. TaxID=1882438 RepID=UPI002844A587|nr:hypothetical protein [Mucilaginibacter sp.]MDR3695533.1 hypothetical protein [Mucilaginibacter sp.]
MATLTKYDSFDALKANTGSGAENLAESNERHRAFEKFINLLQAQVNKSQPPKANKISKKRV